MRDLSCLYVTPLVRGEWLLGLWWQRADGRWDTVHRVRFGLGPFIWEWSWWAKGAHPVEIDAALFAAMLQQHLYDEIAPEKGGTP